MLKVDIGRSSELKHNCDVNESSAPDPREKLTVCAGGRFHPRVDSMDFLQLLNSNIVEFVLIVKGGKERDVSS